MVRQAKNLVNLETKSRKKKEGSTNLKKELDVKELSSSAKTGNNNRKEKGIN